jgi:hypothetical protein
MWSLNKFFSKKCDISVGDRFSFTGYAESDPVPPELIVKIIEVSNGWVRYDMKFTFAYGCLPISKFLSMYKKCTP